ncbi:hypothetical protein JQ557_15680 [Bradyrhizobium sp. U87765 SZCCT0131]|uniref:hypothetical protein n=1 Tax=unclassified Bradyrhizobium TaxID=2631580 RepID=UPI001BAD1327|nr:MULTISPECIES: hypothetical protein [unclassified Bradyrhizobium]MBR1219444.1 hypothetical protein [Bradyrhizobium sp. U87765 SZCCT0131]MBR1262095.1 hypothetical protein [Bradyrhizobium sp. U87765 SZCCT0134]MBR1306052.1 hypothetical protein [Bradyrhizobium sp. U87765 SZCCT0110]MBR1317877.1 hypothetical protein [Bradyrhizobium sp. U87765 SZCCT0109]MBR1351579.1 hypothetical protein [Bradyrhizobium sp. U87765 SZCCT0048]
MLADHGAVFPAKARWRLKAKLTIATSVVVAVRHLSKTVSTAQTAQLSKHGPGADQHDQTTANIALVNRRADSGAHGNVPPATLSRIRCAQFEDLLLDPPEII